MLSTHMASSEFTMGIIETSEEAQKVSWGLCRLGQI